MIASRFRWFVFVRVAILLIVFTLIIKIALRWDTMFTGIEGALFTAAILVMLMIFLLYENRNSARIVADNESLHFRRWLGFSRELFFRYKDFEGYYISKVNSRMGTFRCMYLIRNGKQALFIGEYNYSNYEGFVALAQNRLTCLGAMNTDVIKQASDILHWR